MGEELSRQTTFVRPAAAAGHQDTMAAMSSSTPPVGLPVGGGSGSGGGDDGRASVYADILREQDRLMPTANIARIMRRQLPEHCKVAIDARVTMQECVSEFISFITSE